jgi:hypothetical protein
VRPMRWLLLAGVVILGLGACGGSDTRVPLSQAALAVCEGAPLSEAPRLPASWPDLEALTFTKQSTRGPTEVVEGYYEGDVDTAHDDFKEELEGAGYEILFDEVEQFDSEVVWRAERRSGQVAMRADCGEDDKLYIKVTNRPI